MYSLRQRRWVIRKNIAQAIIPISQITSKTGKGSGKADSTNEPLNVPVVMSVVWLTAVSVIVILEAENLVFSISAAV
ncbi:hypothetical protein D3C78_1678670 [compost metagenome]